MRSSSRIPTAMKSRSNLISFKNMIIPMWRKKPKQVSLCDLNEEPVAIVGNAGISTKGVGDGRMLPLLILDATARPDIHELVRVHAVIQSGDVDSAWLKTAGDIPDIFLHLLFRRPVETSVLLKFDIVKEGVLVDQILTTKAFYLQAGRPGDRFLNTQNAGSIIVEVPATDAMQDWDVTLSKVIAKEMRSQGIGRQEAKRAAREHIVKFRKFGRFRVG